MTGQVAVGDSSCSVLQPVLGLADFVPVNVQLTIDRQNATKGSWAQPWTVARCGEPTGGDILTQACNEKGPVDRASWDESYTVKPFPAMLWQAVQGQEILGLNLVYIDPRQNIHR